MKPFEYYRDPQNITRPSHIEKKRITNALLTEINNTPMTVSERTLALANISKTVTERMNSIASPYENAIEVLRAEFWKDIREYFEYDQLLDEEGVLALEKDAWGSGHSSGYSEVFDIIGSMTDTIKIALKHQKRSKTVGAFAKDEPETAVKLSSADVSERYIARYPNFDSVKCLVARANTLVSGGHYYYILDPVSDNDRKRGVGCYAIGFNLNTRRGLLTFEHRAVLNILERAEALELARALHENDIKHSLLLTWHFRPENQDKLYKHDFSD